MESMGKKKATYPFADLEVGQSFTVPLEKRKTISVCAVQAAKKYGTKYKTKKETEHILVTRIA